MKKPSLLIVGNFLSKWTGTCQYSERLAERLSCLGYSVAYTSDKRSKPFRLLDMILTVLKKRRRYDVAVVDVFSGNAFIWAEVTAALLCFLKKPLVLVLHGGCLANLKNPDSRRLRRLLLKASKVTTPSLYLKKHIQPLISKEINYLPNGILLDRYSFKRRNTVSPKICWVRAFHHTYDPLTVAKIVERILSDYPNAHVTMVGPDKSDGSLQEFEAYVKKHGLKDNISVIGPVPNERVPRLLQDHDCFLNTTLAESFGFAVMEAAACGLCIISTDVGELPYIWESGKNALLVQASNVDAFSKALRTILSDGDLSERLSINARRNAENFDWEKIAVEWQQILNDVYAYE